jgi:hypothetical protein
LFHDVSPHARPSAADRPGPGGEFNGDFNGDFNSDFNSDFNGEFNRDFNVDFNAGSADFMPDFSGPVLLMTRCFSGASSFCWQLFFRLVLFSD